MYREDYALAGYLVLPSNEKRNRFVIWQSVAAAAALLLVGMIPVITRLSGLLYFTGALPIGGLFLYYSARFAVRKTNVAARQLLLLSILYLPTVFALLALDKK